MGSTPSAGTGNLAIRVLRVTEQRVKLSLHRRVVRRRRDVDAQGCRPNTECAPDSANEHVLDGARLSGNQSDQAAVPPGLCPRAAIAQDVEEVPRIDEA